MAETEIAVLGAGIVGLSCAIHLQRRGMETTLVDRGEPGCEASFGNAGILSRGSVLPLGVPCVWRSATRYALNLDPGVRYDPRFLPQLGPWLLRFLRQCTASRAIAISQGLNELLRLALVEHETLVKEAGVDELLKQEGWLRLFHTDRAFRSFDFELAQLKNLGIRTEIVDAGGLRDLEPNLNPVFKTGIWYPETASITDPGKVCHAFAALFAAEGGSIRRDVVSGVQPTQGGWLVQLEGDALAARRVVLALGSWSSELLESLGCRLPLMWERGYHLNFAVQEGCGLNRPINDIEGAYVVAPMRCGHRVTSGIEFASLDEPPNLIQLRSIVRSAREAVNLGESLDAKPWLGRRPSMPDSLPVISAAPGHQNLWLAFGHGHIGFTTGPITGHLVADMVTGSAPVIDPAPFSAERFS